jgi:orotidine-5'-phosphate decarboxylase
MVYLSKLAIDCGLDGLISSPNEVASIRAAIGHSGIIVTPGIRPANTSEIQDQKRVGTAQQALADGADYVVIGRALSDCNDVETALMNLGFDLATA